MTRPLRTLGLTIVAAVAALTISVSAAQAGEFTAEEYPATMTGTQLTAHKFGFTNYSVTCNSTTFHGQLMGASETLTVGASYKQCSSNAGNAVTVNMTGCDYVLGAAETLGENEVDGRLDITCPAGARIDFNDAVTGCAIRILPQVQLTTLKYTDHKMAKDFDVDINLFAINYTENNLCPAGEGMFFNGTYAGQSTMTGDHEGAGTGVTVD
jgi:hypothetical protein